MFWSFPLFRLMLVSFLDLRLNKYAVSFIVQFGHLVSPTLSGPFAIKVNHQALSTKFLTN